VERATAGKVGYLYIPDFTSNGVSEFVRQFHGQIDKAALILDERWCLGGSVTHRLIEILNRPILNYYTERSVPAWPVPGRGHRGPKCLLINGMSASAGENFAYYFRKTGLGKLIGARTWGGLIGLAGNPSLIDGGHWNVPTSAFFEEDGTWSLEGHGIEPDVAVAEDPARMVNGGDPQLDAGIRLMLAELKRKSYRLPHRPAYPDRSGMGIRKEDR
jgi:tricorn protease